MQVMKRVRGMFFNSAHQLLSLIINNSSNLCIQINNFKAKFYKAI
jgi:hypothetical protein